MPVAYGPNQLKGRPRRRHNDHVRRTHAPICRICGFPIDMQADRQRHPLASAVDEWIPRRHGGNPTDPANAAHLHRFCNGVKGSKNMGDPAVLAKVTARCVDHIAALLAGRNPRRRAW